MLVALLSVGLAVVEIAPKAPGEVYKQPRIATAGQTVALAFGMENDIFFSRSDNGGRTFTSPVALERRGVLSLGMRRGPRIAMTGSTIAVTAIAGKQGRGQDGDLFVWRSTDGGRTWATPVRINDRENSAREGLHGFSAGSDGSLFAVWLDLRSKGTRVYGATSRDGLNWSNRLIYESPDGTVCECCHPTALAGAGGRLYVLFRNSLEGARDMYLSESSDGGKSYRTRKMGSGTWPLNACPMDGGDLALDASGVPQTVWRRGMNLFSAAGGGSVEKALGAGRDASIATGPNGTYYGWKQGNTIWVRRPGGGTPEPLSLVGGYVNLAGGERVFAAWEDNGSIRVADVTGGK